ncbi:MAG: 2-C-methyl-D-erythritol 4-phosphate cytidylyltransferase [Desulfatiglandales bacterium]
MPTIIALIAAGGMGQRFGSSYPKQFWILGGKTVIEHSLMAFEENPSVDGIHVVIPKDYMERFSQLRLPMVKLKKVVEGGKTRQESVYKGLLSIEGDCRWVLIHDAARPLVESSLITSVLKKAMEAKACVPAIPLRDTVKLSSQDRKIIATLKREELISVQTPQAFVFEEILLAHEMAKRDGIVDAPDDAFLLERMGIEVSWIEGDPTNLKLTYPSDLPIMEALLRAKRYEKDQDRDPQE